MVHTIPPVQNLAVKRPRSSAAGLALKHRFFIDVFTAQDNSLLSKTKYQFPEEGFFMDIYTVICNFLQDAI